MQDEHFYTRALKLNPENAFDYYLGRAEWYCMEHEYEKAYEDLCKAEELISDNLNYRKRFKKANCYDCGQFINSEKYIETLSKEIEEDPDNCNAYLIRAKMYLLQRQYTKAINDAITALQIRNDISTYRFLHNLFSKITEFNVFDIVKKSKGSDSQTINALRYRIKLAEEKIVLSENSEYWQKRAELDLAEISELSEDKTLALYYKATFYENIKNFDNAVFYCQKVVEQSEERTDNLGKALTYLYKFKLASLNLQLSAKNKNHMNAEYAYEKLKRMENCTDKPAESDINKAIEYINEYAFYSKRIMP
ncbi:MAG: hypothetical protein VZR09_09105 [Candidatus Gastranaerophilaceae bacterium]|nr:hypothetical protein [Candidatus Gastranaerophilaceae bacterium]